MKLHLAHTLITGPSSNLCEQFNEVWKVVSQEFGANNHVLAGMVGLQSRAEKFGLTLYPESRSSFRVLYKQMSQYILPTLFQSLRLALTLNAYRSRPSARPGRGWNRVPACETRATVATGPGISLAAILMP